MSFLRWMMSRPLLALLFITFVANVPFLTPNQILNCDTFGRFTVFQYVYTQLYFYDELPRWAPLLGYGMTSDIFLFGVQPTGLVMMMVGWLLDISDALLLFKLGMILDHFLYILGFYLLSSKLIASKVVVFLICLGAILTDSWLLQCAFNFLSFYLLPLVCYFLSQFMESRKAGHLWMAGIVEVYSLVGNIPYVAPLHLLILIAFVLPSFWQNPSLREPIVDLATWFFRLPLPSFWQEPRIPLVFWYWRSFLHPLFLVFAGFLVLVAMFMLGMLQSLSIISGGREVTTGQVSLNGFLTYGAQPLGGIAAAFLRGDIFHGDLTCYVGLLPLLSVGWALARRKDALFLGVSCVVLVLFWFSLGGWFSACMFYCIPLMSNFRHIRAVFDILKIFLLIVGGCGIDQLIKDITRNPAADTRDDVSGFRQRVHKCFLLLCFLDLLLCIAPFDFKGLANVQIDATPHYIFVRFLAYAGVFTGLVVLLKQGYRTGHAPAHKVYIIFFLLYTADIGLYYSSLVQNAPLPVQIDTLLHVRRMAWSAERTLYPTSEHARRVYNVLNSPRGNISRLIYWEIHLLMNEDPVFPEPQVTLVSRGVKDMIEARGGVVTRHYGFGVNPVDSAFVKSISTKMCIIRDVTFAPDYESSIRSFARLDDPYHRLVLTGEGGAFPTGRLDRSQVLDKVKVTSFSANRVKVEVTAESPGWLFYADAYHPAWKASVQSQEVEVIRANVGFKAVPLPGGVSQVEFYFDDGLRGWIRTGMYLLTLAVTFSLFGFLVVVCLTQREVFISRVTHENAQPMETAVLPRTDQEKVGPLHRYLAWVIVICFAAALGIVVQNWLTVYVLFFIAVWVFAVTEQSVTRGHTAIPGTTVAAFRPWVPLLWAVLVAAWVYRTGLRLPFNITLLTMLTARVLTLLWGKWRS